MKELDHPSILNWSATGSRIICDPPPGDTDEDYVVLFDPRRDDGLPHLEGAGFKYDSALTYKMNESQPSDRFLSLRRDPVNLIVTSDGSFFEKFVRATNFAARYNIREKSDRIYLFQAVLYGNG